MPSLRADLMMRQAISPRLAIRILSNMRARRGHLELRREGRAAGPGHNDRSVGPCRGATVAVSRPNAPAPEAQPAVSVTGAAGVVAHVEHACATSSHRLQA